MTIPDSLINASPTAGDDGTVYLRSYRNDDDTTPLTIINVYDADLNYQNTFYYAEGISIIRCYGDTIIAASPKYPEADALDPASELRIIKIFDRLFNLLSSYESIDAFASHGNIIENLPLRPATSVIPLSGNRCMTTIPSGFYSTDIDDDGTAIISSKILIIYDNKGNLLGRYSLPGDIKLTIQSSDTIYGYSSFYGPVLYKLSLTSFIKE